ncbi:MAG: Ig-like domain-containing protein [Tannerella sp.]|nr:Ig-like domain-containing protein [Tannerella sp.]
MSLRNESLALPVGERSRIKVTFTPTDADNVTLMWSSSNESVATVSDDGILTVVGVGTAVITVSSGSISKTVHVEGTIRSLAITAPEETKIRVGAEFTLSAIPDPSDIQVAAVWSSDNEAVATVNASTGEVTVVGNGTANIQATVGSVVSSYAVVCEDLLDSAAGYWEFDDPNDIGKAIKGSSLKPQGEGIRWVEGPSDENLAIEVPMHEYFIADLSGATPNGGSEDDRTHKRVYQWSMMMDFRFPTVKGYYYTQHGGVNMSDGDFFVRYNNDQMLAGKGTYIPFFEADPNQPYTAWVRLVITCDNGTMRMYCNGVETDGGGLSYPLALSIDPRYSLPTDGPLYIFGEPKGTTSDGKPDFSASDDDSPFPCAAIAFWDKTLTAGQVKALGSIAH